MHFDSGQEFAGVTDRLIGFERLVGEYETPSGELLSVQVKCSVLLKRLPSKLRTHLLVICASRPDCAIMRQTVGCYSVARRSRQPSQPTSMGEAPMEIDAFLLFYILTCLLVYLFHSSFTFYLFIFHLTFFVNFLQPLLFYFFYFFFSKKVFLLFTFTFLLFYFLVLVVSFLLFFAVRSTSQAGFSSLLHSKNKV